MRKSCMVQSKIRHEEIRHGEIGIPIIPATSRQPENPTSRSLRGGAAPRGGMRKALPFLPDFGKQFEQTRFFSLELLLGGCLLCIDFR